MESDLKSKAAVHRGYAIVAEITKFWSSRSATFDPCFWDGEMTADDLNKLIALLKRMRAKCRSAIDELKILSD
jgi:hypothetical protein